MKGQWKKLAEERAKAPPRKDGLRVGEEGEGGEVRKC